MQVAINASIQGMQRATDRLAEAATVVAAPAASPARGSDPSPAPPTGNEGLTTAQASGDIERAMVDAMQARRAYEANAKALETNAQLQREALSRRA
jgi:flagellar basal body rod protein FlgC